MSNAILRDRVPRVCRIVGGLGTDDSLQKAILVEERFGKA